ncbi:ESX secretion-associated protein EspG [Nocardia panacis]|uniref:ESX secretion-associated protein EspG n=1 Tax=Nocardia panacis TaxID=2340916 RepID=UPI001EF0FDDF|nr:ESX secretion-associated protein EspG [Nocardia panacis]
MISRRWYSDAYDRLPNPLHYTSRFAFRDEFQAHRRTVLGRYSPRELEEIRAALDTLGRAQARIEIIGGTCKHRNSKGPGDIRLYRMVGGRTPHGGVVMTQYGSDGEYGAIRVRTCGAEAVPSRLAAGIPACPPGSAKPMTFHPEELKPRQDTYLQDVARNTPREHYRRLLRRPTDGSGTAVLLPGSVHTRTQPWQTLQWHDISEDGRYTEVRAEHVTVRPTTVPELSAQFAAWFDRALQRIARS